MNSKLSAPLHLVGCNMVSGAGLEGQDRTLPWVYIIC